MFYWQVLWRRDSGSQFCFGAQLSMSQALVFLNLVKLAILMAGGVDAF